MSSKKYLKQSIDPVNTFNIRQSNSYRFVKMFLIFSETFPEVELTPSDLSKILKKIVGQRAHPKVKTLPPKKFTQEEIYLFLEEIFIEGKSS